MRTHSAALAAPLLLLALAACDQAPPRAEKPAAPAAAPAAPSAAAPAPAASAPQDLIARGTEPFWAVEVKSSGLKLMRPDHPDLIQPNSGAKAEGPALLWSGPAFRLVVEVSECSDGMSDRRYPFAAEVRLAGGGVLRGCAGKDDRPTPGTAPPAP